MLFAELFHPLAARVTLGLFALIWGSAVAAGLFADTELMVFIKEGAVWALFLLVPAAMLTAATGLRLGYGRPGPITERKRRRLRLIVALSVVVVLPATLALDALVQQGQAGSLLFLVLQGVELVAGLLTLGLMVVSVRDGLLAKREARAAASAGV
jgi:hypothetical protein